MRSQRFSGVVGEQLGHLSPLVRLSLGTAHEPAIPGRCGLFVPWGRQGDAVECVALRCVNDRIRRGVRKKQPSSTTSNGHRNTGISLVPSACACSAKPTTCTTTCQSVTILSSTVGFGRWSVGDPTDLLKELHTRWNETDSRVAFHLLTNGVAYGLRSLVGPCESVPGKLLAIRRFQMAFPLHRVPAG